MDKLETIKKGFEIIRKPLENIDKTLGNFPPYKTGKGVGEKLNVIIDKTIDFLFNKK